MKTLKNRLKNKPDFWLFTTPIAHRGLFDENNPENTTPALLKAIEKNYVIEFDIQMSKDGVLFVFHDDNAKRVLGIDKDVRTMTFEEISSYTPFNKGYKILTFKEFLSLVDGKVPLLIEIKNAIQGGIIPKFIEEIKDYKGEYVVQSFNPLLMRQVEKLAPNMIRGVLTTREYPESVSKFNKKLLMNFWFKLFVHYDFLNERIEDLKINKRRSKNAPVICWTARSKEDIEFAKQYSLNAVFEKPAEEFMHLFY